MSDVQERMQEKARAVQSILPPNTGFIVLAFDHGKPGGPLEYVSNSKREDFCRAMLEFVEKSAESFGAHEHARLLSVQWELDPGEYQFILLALAELALRRPGWNYMLSEFAKKVGGTELFEKFKLTSLTADDCQPVPMAPGDIDLFRTCVHALKSYAYGNASPDLANEIIGKIDERLLW